MGLNLSAFDDVLKNKYEGPIREQITQRNVLYDNLKTDVSKEMFYGRQAHLPLHTGRNVGVGVAAEAPALLPTAGNQQYDKAVYNMAYLYGRIAISGPTISAAKTNKGSFARALESEMSGVVNDISHSMNRQAWHNGTGLLTEVASNSTTTVTVTDTKFLQVGMKITIAIRVSGAQTGLTAANATDVAIVSIPSATTFTLAADPGTCASTMGVYVSGSRDLSDWDNMLEMNGLEGICSTDNPAALEAGVSGAEDGFTATPSTSFTLGQIDRDSNTFWHGNVIDSTITFASDLEDMQQAYDEAEFEVDGDGNYAGLIVTSVLIRRKIGGLMTADRRYDDGRKFKTGWTGLEFNDAVIYGDKWASTCNHPINNVVGASGTGFDRMYFINPDALEYQVLEELAWEDTGGVVVRAGVGAAGVDQVEAYMRTYMNLCATRPNACVLLHGIAF